MQNTLALFLKKAEIYQKIPIGFGIMERSDGVAVFATDMGWNDVGSWDALGNIFSPDDKGIL